MRALGALLALLALSVVSAAGAASTASLIEWEAPEACSGALDVHARLSALLGHEPESLGTLSRVRGSVVQTAHGYRLVLETFEQGRRSSRLFEAASCDDLVDAATLAIALAMAPDPPLASPGAVPAASSAPPLLTPGESAVSVGVSEGRGESELRATGTASAGPRAFAAAEAVVEYGALPQLATGLSVAGGAQVGALSFGAYGVLLGSEELSVAPAQTAQFELLFGGVRACYALLSAAPRLDACLAWEMGRFSARGLELAPSREVQDLWLAPGAGLQAQWPLSGGLGIELRAESMLPLNRKQYTVNKSESVHAPALLSSRVYLGLTLLSN